MTLIGNAIPVAVLRSQGQEKLVSPAMDEWWENLQPLRWASKTGLLFCPDCGGRLAFCCGTKIPTPYFKHLEDSCVAMGPSRGGVGGAGRAWDRHQLVVSLRQAFPAGTSIDCADYLFGRRSWVEITRPGEKPFMLEVAVHQLDLAAWEERKAAAAARGVLLFALFTGDLIPPVLLDRVNGQTAATPLKPEHDAAARAFKVDLAHVEAAHHYRLDPQRVKGEPRTLYFFAPGRKQGAPGALAILRGILPDPDQLHVWYGRMVTADMTGNGAGPLRFSLRHGFYTQDDVAIARKRRDVRRARRKAAREAPIQAAQPLKPQQPASAAPQWAPPGWHRLTGPAQAIQRAFATPSGSTSDGALNLTLTHRREVAGRRTFFISHSGLRPSYVHPSPGGQLVVMWNGRRYEGCEETTIGAADKEIRQYRR